MTVALVQNWYVLWGIGATALLIAFVIYAHKHPDSAAMPIWQRLKYACAAAAVFGAILLLITGIFLPDVVPLAAMPYFSGALLVVGWFAAPVLRKWLPLERGET